MAGLPLLTFCGGGVGGSSTFNAKQCCAVEVFFCYSRNGFKFSIYFKNSFMSYRGLLI